MSSEHESTVIFGSRADLRAERKRKRDESGDWDMLSHPDLRSILQQKERLGNILMKYYPTLLHLPADAMPETPPVGNHSYTVKPAGPWTITEVWLRDEVLRGECRRFATE